MKWVPRDVLLPHELVRAFSTVDFVFLDGHNAIKIAMPTFQVLPIQPNLDLVIDFTPSKSGSSELNAKSNFSPGRALLTKLAPPRRMRSLSATGSKILMASRVRSLARTVMVFSVRWLRGLWILTVFCQGGAVACVVDYPNPAASPVSTKSL